MMTVLGLLTLSLLWFGGYYEYCSAIMGVVAAVVILIRKKREHLKMENFILFAGLLVFFYLISCIYAVDTGMALTGVAKKSTLLLFAFVVATLSMEQRRTILYKLPELAFLVTVVGALMACIPALRENVIRAGRFTGTFGYANVYALFMLLGIAVLFERMKRQQMGREIITLSVLAIGLWYSGSRYTWILMLLLLVVQAIQKKKARIWILVIIGVLIVATVSAGTIFHQSEAMGRFFSTNLSTFYGRLLYWRDGCLLLAKHPFGMGYLGFFYEQTVVQTGVYSVRYVHNDLLQWCLDIGCLQTLVLLAFIGYAIKNKSRSFLEKIMLITILLHSFMEFDFEYTAIGFILILVLSCTQEQIFSGIHMQKRMYCLLAVALGSACLYFSVPLSLYAAGRTQQAAVWYPLYTDALLSDLAQETDIETGERLANRISNYNDTAFLAYDMKAQAAYQKLDFTNMVRYKKEAIKRNRFDANEYLDYLNMLNEVLVYSQENQDEELQKIMITRIKEVPGLIENNKSTVSELGKRIDDKVAIDLSEELKSEIQDILY